MSAIIPFLVSGLIGSLLMFAGDMLLCFCKEDYEDDGTMQPVFDIMKKVSVNRLYIGSLLGPVASFFYAIGYYHTVIMMPAQLSLGLVCFLVNSFGVILGGAYHSHWVYFGRMSRLENKKAVDEIVSFTTVLKSLAYVFMGIGFLLIAVVIGSGLSVFPRWMLFFTPGILLLLRPLLKKLPKGFRIVISGGWSNLISVIYYTVGIILASRI